MILLETANVIVRNLVLEWLEKGAIRTEFTCVDFDGASFKIYVTDNKDALIIAFKSPASKSLLQNCGGLEYLKKVYGLYLIAPINGFDVTLQIPTTVEGDKAAFALRVASLKSYLYASPVLVRMEAATKGQTIAGLLDIPLRSNKERMWVKQDGTDRMTVIFSIYFEARNDAILGEVFCTEFSTVKDAAAPSVTYSEKAPLELKGCQYLPDGEGVSYLTFVLYDRHWKGIPKMEASAFTVVTFRNYLHYHLKCCKSYLHTRMRTRVENLLKVLNRAKQETTSQKKTATGRTFNRK